ncbi:8257_t:CDS:2 [Dentiscutata erythropus]|uniref:8257_t:CDS:1 n=1 Tax=Dentiscutata erythropus TaxID=1348616 RepID=A0A9N9IIE4_9GLOM|nr:8257_t:CDS:2 [Dentiscutata erythropus]
MRAIIKGLRQLSQNHIERATANTNSKEYKLVDFPIFSGSHDDDPVEWYEAFNRACIKLELKLKEEDITKPMYTTIQVGNNFTQLEDQLIANVKIENINNPLQYQPDDIFRLIQPEMKKIKES